MNVLLFRRSRWIANFALLAIIPVLVPALCSAQLEGSFSLSKAEYLAGEPIFLSFTITNTGDQPFVIGIAKPLTPCSGYHFEVVGERDRESGPCGRGVTFVSCVSDEVTLQPGENRTDRILLNARYDLRQPGRYALNVTYRLKYRRPADKDLPSLDGGPIFESHQEIVIQPSKADDLRPAFAEYVKALDSANAHTRREAAEIIAYLAPSFMEATIINMLKTPRLQSYGVEGLHNLGTSSAHHALAEFVRNSPPTNSVGPYQDALGYLGEIGDPSDIALLLNAAHANAPDSLSRELAIESAGETGGAEAVPNLVAELNDPSINTEQAAVRALYLTGSRAAVPVLIGLLRSPEWRVSSTAEYGLHVLTHRSGATTNSMNPPPADTTSKWTRWWTSYGDTATIFKPDQCGDIVPLP